VLGEMVKVLVFKELPEGGYVGFWAEFEGEKVSSYEDTRGDNNIVHTLYKCTGYNSDAYRVHIANISVPADPDYALHPVRWDMRVGGGRPDFSEVWDQEEIARLYPTFIKDLEGYLPTRNVDGPPSF
jgi:hypothetical protein